MTISALVVTLDLDGTARAQALEELSKDARLWLGEPVGSRLPLVAQTGDALEGAALVDDLFQTVGVRFVDVVAVDLSDTDAEEL